MTKASGEHSPQQGHDDAVATPDPDAEWWTTSDVAAYLGVRVGTVSGYRIREQMPAPDLTVGRTHMWRPERIVEWHEARPRPGVGGRPVAPSEVKSDMQPVAATPVKAKSTRRSSSPSQQADSAAEGAGVPRGGATTNGRSRRKKATGAAKSSVETRTDKE